jgi:hypothetical protein
VAGDEAIEQRRHERVTAIEQIKGLRWRGGGPLANEGADEVKKEETMGENARQSALIEGEGRVGGEGRAGGEIDLALQAAVGREVGAVERERGEARDRGACGGHGGVLPAGPGGLPGDEEG